MNARDFIRWVFAGYRRQWLYIVLMVAVILGLGEAERQMRDSSDSLTAHKQAIKGR
jgi:hypothetical protein